MPGRLPHNPEYRRVVAEGDPSIPFGTPPWAPWTVSRWEWFNVLRFQKLCFTEKLRKCIATNLHGPTFMIDGRTLSLTMGACGFTTAYWSTMTLWLFWAWVGATQLCSASHSFHRWPRPSALFCHITADNSLCLSGSCP